MRARLPLLLVFAVIVTLAGLSGCSTIAAVSQAIDEAVVGIGQDTATTPPPPPPANNTVAEPAPATGTEPGMSVLGKMAAMQQLVAFNFVYLQVIFIGGFDPGFDDFSEGEGITWKISSGTTDEDTFTAERALLKRNPDGTSWWFLGYGDKEQSLDYEILMDTDYAPLQLRWKDPDSGNIAEHTFTRDEEQSVSSADQSTVYSEDTADEISRGTERVTVEAGTYSAEHLVYEFTDPNTSDTLEYHWWVASEVPGDLVKYRYVSTSGGDQDTLNGELVDVHRGYTTRFGSY